MMLLHLLLCLVGIVALAHLLAGRIPDWLFVFLPCIFFVPDLFNMSIDWGTAPDWLGLCATGLGLVIAYRAFSQWKHELVVTRRFDVALSLVETLSSLELLLFDASNSHEHRNRCELGIRKGMVEWKSKESLFDGETNVAVPRALGLAQGVLNQIKVGEMAVPHDFMECTQRIALATKLLIQYVKINT